jgi:TRAP-type C4-dicarboxylate transport system permease small subunit
VAAIQKRLIVGASVLWVVWVALTWMTSTWKDQTEAGQTQVILWSALSQMVFWVGLVCVAWAVGFSVLRRAERTEHSD